MTIIFNAYNIRKDILRNPMELGLFITKYRKHIKGKRIIYLLAAKQDNHSSGDRKIDDDGHCVLKVGIAVNGDPVSRLKDYISYYGHPHRRYPCRGVYIYFCLATKWTADDRIPRIGTLVYKLEQSLITLYPNVRGRERIKANPRDACTLLETQKFPEVRPLLRTSPRNAQKITPDRNRWIFVKWNHYNNVPPEWYMGKVLKKTQANVHVDYRNNGDLSGDVHIHHRSMFYYGKKGTWVYVKDGKP